MLGLQLAYNGIAEGAVFALAGLGFAIIFNTARELHFAYGAVVTASAYVIFAVSSAGVPFYLGVVVGVVFAAVLAALVRMCIYRGLDHDRVLLFSFGLAIVIENLLQAIYGPNYRGVTEPSLEGQLNFPEIGLSMKVVGLVTIGVAIVVAIVMWFVLSRTRFGLAMNAVMKDPEMAELVGVRSELVKGAAYAIGSGIAALAAASTVVDTGVVPTAGFNLLLYAFLITLLAKSRFNLIIFIGLGFGLVTSLAAWIMPARYSSLIAFTLILAYLLIQGRRVPILAK